MFGSSPTLTSSFHSHNARAPETTSKNGLDIQQDLHPEIRAESSSSSRSVVLTPATDELGGSELDDPMSESVSSEAEDSYPIGTHRIGEDLPHIIVAGEVTRGI